MSQKELFADTTYQIIFRDMLKRDGANLGPTGLAVFMAIKAFSNFKTGETFVSAAKLASLLGCSPPTIFKAIATLKKFGYLEASKQGRKNVYVVKEKISIENDQGKEEMLAVFNYVPHLMKNLVNQIRDVLVTGKIGDNQNISFIFKQVNIMVGDNAQLTTNNVDMGNPEEVIQDQELRDRFLAAFAKRPALTLGESQTPAAQAEVQAEA